VKLIELESAISKVPSTPGRSDRVRGGPGTRAQMGDTPLPRINVDFNNGGRSETGERITMLNPKSGDRACLNPRMREELENAGFQPHEGMRVRLVAPQADLADDGTVCDMRVDARIVISPGGEWAAVWDWDAMEWVTSEPDVSS
jgi:hypothetical protein